MSIIVATFGAGLATTANVDRSIAVQMTWAGASVASPGLQHTGVVAIADIAAFTQVGAALCAGRRTSRLCLFV